MSEIQKKIVRYSAVYGDIVVGRGASVFPVDHPDSENVSNEHMAWTSTVVSYDETTEIFETLNTVYVPA